jgi:hypothetical protein
MPKMKYFSEMTNSQFGAAHKYYQTKSALELAKFWEYSANAMHRYIKTGRVDYINNLVGDSLNCGRFQAFIRVNKSLCAHEWDAAERQFVGKADKAKLKRLRKETDEGVAKWEQMFYDHLQKELTFSETTPKTDWSMEKRVLNLVKACMNHDESHDEVMKAIEAAWKDERKARVEKAAKAA